MRLIHPRIDFKNAEEYTELLRALVVSNVTDEISQDLRYAVSEERCDIIKVLLAEPCCDVNFVNESGETALHLAVDRIKQKYSIGLEMLQMLSKHPDIAKSLVTLNEEKNTPLTNFLRSVGNVSKFKLQDSYAEIISLLTPKPEVLSVPSYTLALIFEYSPYELCESLVKRGAAVNVCYPDNETVLHCAVRIDSIEKCKLLVEHKASLDVKWKNLTPFELAITLGCQTKIIELLGDSLPHEVKLDTLKKLSFNHETVKAHAQRLHLDHWVQPMILAAESATTRTSNHYLYNTEIPRETRTIDASLLHELIIASPLCNYSSEKQIILDHILLLVRKLSTRLSARTETAHLTFDPIIAGSMAEGSKTFFLDECDVVCLFNNTSALNTNEYRIDFPSDSLWKRYSLDKQPDRLMPRLVAEHFYDEITHELSEMFHEGESFGNLKFACNSLERRDKISCLKLLWHDVNTKDTLIHVDLVIAIPDMLTPHIRPGLEPLIEVNRDYQVITKASRHDFSAIKTEFKSSFSSAENKLIQQLPYDIKQGLVFAKAIRVACISAPDVIDDLKLCEKIKVDDVITSFMLKTCLANLLQDSSRRTGTAFDWTERIYMKLEQCAQKGEVQGYVAFAFLCQTDYAFHCRHKECPLLYECCLKRQILLRLCRTILTWLRHNKQELVMLTKWKPIQWFQHGYQKLLQLFSPAGSKEQSANGEKTEVSQG